MTKTVSIDTATIKEKVKSHLAIIGKRLNHKPGDKNYQYVTLTDNEITIIDDYFKAAVSYLAAQFPEVLITYKSDGTQEYDDTRYDNQKNTALQDVYQAYVFAFCIMSYLAMNYPDLAKKYQTECAEYITAARSLIYVKTPPAPAADKYDNVKGDISE